jgi:hypothetical protein
MVSIANQTVQNYIESLDENIKKEVFHVLASKSEDLENEYNNLKETTIGQLETLAESNTDEEIKSKIVETIGKIQSESFDQINYVRLKQLKDSILLGS